MKNKTIEQDECQPLTSAEVQQIYGGGKGFISVPPGMFPPGLIITPFPPICGPLPIFDPELGITVN